ncbi:MAG TPA: hypothetical protein VM620_03910 [Hyphomicrobium sp.]|nr:hypothetical protein [Hyphomicrobium sp.]
MQMIKIYLVVIMTLMHSALAIAEEVFDWQTRAREIYSNQETVVRHEIEKKTKEYLAIAKSEGRELSEEAQRLMRTTTQNVEYQYLLDRMFCAEQFLKSKKYPFTGDDKERDRAMLIFNECDNIRSAASLELFRFASHYGNQFPHEWNACLAKHRLLTLEARYPPFAFMRSIGHEYEAYDAAELLACVKSRI